MTHSGSLTYIRPQNGREKSNWKASAVRRLEFGSDQLW